MYYFISIQDEYEIQLEAQGKTINDVLGVNLDQIDYCIDNEFVDMAVLYMAYQYYLDRKQIAVSNQMLTLFETKRSQYKTKIVTSRAKEFRSHVVIARKLV
jgi:hypothetical protein